MKKILVFHTLLFPVLFGIWYFCFPDYLWWVESKAFFVDIPDYYAITFPLPGHIGDVASNYVAQFYKWRVYGALWQAGFAMAVLYACDRIIYRITREKYTLWLTFIPVCLFFMFQPARIDLLYSVYYSAAAVAVAILIGFFPRLRLRAGSASRLFLFRRPVFSYLLPVLFVAAAAAFVCMKTEYRDMERLCRLERWASLRRWDRIDANLPPEATAGNPFYLRYALLALSEKRELPDRLFCYPVDRSNCFLYERVETAFCRDFNSVFFDCLGVLNEALHHASQGGILENPGMTFLNFRRTIDWYIRLGHYRAAEKYLDILARSTCHRNWVKSRREILAGRKAKGEVPDEAESGKAFFIGVYPFLSDMARLVDRDPDNLRAVHYLLCGILIKKNMEQFGQVFSICYPHLKTRTLPQHYEEALIMLAQKDPAVLTKYPIRPERIRDFENFCQWAQKGQVYESMLRGRYGNTFWYYFRFRNLGDDSGAAPAVPADGLH